VPVCAVIILPPDPMFSNQPGCPPFRISEQRWWVVWMRASTGMRRRARRSPPGRL